MFDGLYAVVMSGSLIGIFLQVVPITFLVGLVYAIYRLVKIRKRELSVSWGAEIMRWLFVCYLTGLINLVLVPRNFWTYIWLTVIAVVNSTPYFPAISTLFPHF